MTSWLTVEPCAILDQNNLPVQSLSSGVNALNVRFYTPDTTSPELQEFDLDMNLGTLTMRFSETVSGPHLMASQDHSTNQSPTPISILTLCTLCCSIHTHLELKMHQSLSPEIILMIRILDLNEIKRLTELATSREDTFISVTSTTIQDTKGNLLVRIAHTMGLQVTNYTEDTTRPELVSFDLDLSLDVLTLTFDETVSGSTLMETEIVLQQFQENFIEDDIYQLVGSPHDNFESTIVKVYFSFEDRNAIKKLRNLATRPRNTWIVFTEALINDTNSNPVIPIPNNADVYNRVRNYTPDTVEPQLVNFSLNLTSEILTLSFSETVDISTIDLTRLGDSELGRLNSTIG